VVALAALVACNSAPAATTDFWGPTIEPPRGLAQLAPGMSVDEARRRVPDLHEPRRRGLRDELVLDTGVSDVKLTVRVEQGTVSSIVAIVQGQRVREMLARAWGEPEIVRDALGQPEVTWASEATGWRVKLDCLERNCIVEYVPYRVLTADYFGAHVMPPGDLAKLRIGMPVAEAQALAPGPVSVRGGIATQVDGVREYVALDDQLGVVRSIYLNLPAGAEPLIELAWGPGAIATLPGNKHVKVWPDPSTRWRATLRQALGTSHDLVFDNYLPAAALFGDLPDTIEALPTPVLGATVDEVKRAYPGRIAIAGKDLVLALPPTEWDWYPTRITMTTSGGRVRALELSIPVKAHAAARETLLELFRYKWGTPVERRDGGVIVLVYRQADPRVEVREDSDHGTWEIELR
jgi:hypothetical protein